MCSLEMYQAPIQYNAIQPLAAANSSRLSAVTGVDTAKVAEQSFIRFDREICGNLEAAEAREWWMTNGTGAYAAGTLAGSLTRRYHGLLITPLQGGLDRHLLLAKADATLHLRGRDWPLFTNRWQGNVIEPAGHLTLESFHLEGRMPVWRYVFGDVSLEMRIWMAHGEAATYVAYKLEGPAEGATLSVNLLINRRDHHQEMCSGCMHAQISLQEGRLDIVWPEGDRMQLQGTQLDFVEDLNWFEGFYLCEEQARGLQALDNHLSIGRLRFALTPGSWNGFAATTNPSHEFALEQRMDAYLRREKSLLKTAESTFSGYRAAPAWVRQLLLAADSFLIKRRMPTGRAGDSVIAGYPWFGDWGRDTMIALPGLTLATGRPATALAMLRSYAALVDQGQLPNRLFSAGEPPEYNTVDAALWFIQTWFLYIETTGDDAALTWVFPVLQEIIEWHIKGTRHGIGMDPDDHLLAAGEPGRQLTWMDAKVGDWVVTPRIGKPVEINALWYNALCIMGGFSRSLGRPPTEYEQLALKVKQSLRRFVRADGLGLYDLLDGPQGQDCVRPNQILAVSLPHTALDSKVQREVVAICQRDLLCAYGLRSLSPHDSDYIGIYRGGVVERDSAYHQGTVWGWLLGHYALAEYRVTGDAPAAMRRLEPLAEHLKSAGLGTISEIFDGTPPHPAKGAPAQAWSVGCTLEAWWRLQQIMDEKHEE